MDCVVLAYIIYLVISIALTIWVATTLFKNGKRFLIDIFHGDHSMADSVNRLLLVGFYLLNIGYAVLTLRVWGEIENYREMIETLSYKLGAIIIVLGIMHFLNLLIFYSLRKKAKKHPLPPKFTPPS